MKKIIFNLFFLLSIFSFSAINDNLKIFKAEEIKIIEEKIKEIEKQKDIAIYLNTLSIGEGFTVSDPEGVVILNLKKEDKEEKYETEISFSRDIPVDDSQEEINEILETSKEILSKKEYSKYVLTILDGVGAVLENVKIEKLNQMTMTKTEENQNNSKWLILIIVLALVGYFGYNYMQKTKNKENKEKEIE